MKKINAAKLDAHYSKDSEEPKVPQRITGASDFPKYDEYEVVAGKKK